MSTFLDRIFPNVNILPLALAALFAAIPIAIWFYIFFSEEKSKKTAFTVFGIGCLTAPSLLYLQVIWEKYPQFNLQALIEKSVKTPSLMVVGILLLFVVMEEIIKFAVVKIVDEKTLLVHKLNDAIRYSITAALGFAFTENIYYLYQFYPSISQGELLGMYIFRSIFTTCAHLIFTGIFGYFYGIGKFSIIINQQKSLSGSHDKIAAFIAKTFDLPISEGFRQKTVLKGLFLAISMHFLYNYTLEGGYTIPAIIFVVAGFLFIQYLLNRKVGHLILTLDPTTNKPSTIAKKDKDVVVELLGMWFQEKRYPDVLHVCERLLERDPDNKVVKLFKAQAMDKMEDHDTYKKILGTVIKTKDDLSQNQQNIITKYIKEKEELKKVKQMIANQLKKEGKQFIQPVKVSSQSKQNITPISQNAVTNSPENKPISIVDKYAGSGSFKLEV